MDKFRSRSTHEGQGSGARPRWAFAVPGTHTRRPALGRWRLVTRFLLLAVLASSSLALTQCRMVGDSLTGVRVDSFKRKSDCVKGCKDVYKNDRKAENDLHASINSGCGGDSACRAEENARHEAALQGIEAAYANCVNSCHEQGGGTVGP